MPLPPSRHCFLVKEEGRPSYSQPTRFPSGLAWLPMLGEGSEGRPASSLCLALPICELKASAVLSLVYYWGDNR